MPTVAARRPAHDSTATLPPRRPSHHWRTATVLAGATLTSSGALSLAGSPWWPAAAVAGAAAAAGTGVAGELRVARREVADRLAAALAGPLGLSSPDRRVVRLRRWSRGWPGTPGRVVVRYPRHGERPGLAGLVAAEVSRHCGAPYTVASSSRGRMLLLRALDEGTATTGQQRAADRVRTIVTDLVGSTGAVTDLEFRDDDPVRFRVSHEATTKAAVPGFRLRVERTVSAVLPGRWRVVWDLEGDTAWFEQRPVLPDSVWLLARPVGDVEDLLRNYRRVEIPYAVDEDGVEITWRPAELPHMMLVGSTGSGKTSLAHTLLAQITRYGWPVWVLDAKRIEFLDLRSWPNVQVVAGTIPQQVALVHRAWGLMEYRYRLIDEGRARVEDFEPLVVFLDEFAEFRAGLLEWYATVKVKGDPSKPPALQEVGSLARKGRTARIHLVLSTQRPDAEFLGGEVRDNFPARVSLGRLSPAGAVMMWESSSAGVALPRGKTGRGMAVGPGGFPVEVQSYRFPSLSASAGTDEARLLDSLRPGDARHERLLILPPQPQPGQGLLYRDYAMAEWVRAADRPDLDPLLAAPDREGGSGRDLSSPMASLGLVPGAAAPTGSVLLPAADPGAGSTTGSVIGADDDFAGYSDPQVCGSDEVVVGDLVELDDGRWVVVDGVEPDGDQVVLGWRSDDDDDGMLSVPADEMIEVRRPCEDD